LIINKIDGLVLASSGNAGIAIAWYASKIKGPKIYLYLPECSRYRMEEAIKKFTTKDIVKVIYVGGSTDEAGDEAKEFAEAKNLPYGTGFKNYSRREGVKTIALEYLFEQNKRADWYVQGVAGALAIHAFYKVHKELDLKCPKIAGIQPDCCPPFVDAFRENASVLEDKYIPKKPVIKPEAPVLKSRKPIVAYPVIKSEIDEVGGYFEKVTAEEIVDALKAFYMEDYFKDKYNKTKVQVGIEASTALAGIIKMRKNNIVKNSETVLVNVSGAARPGAGQAGSRAPA
jgi:threonine synthase